MTWRIPTNDVFDRGRSHRPHGSLGGLGPAAREVSSYARPGFTRADGNGRVAVALGLGLVAVAGLALGTAAARRRQLRHPPDSAPGRTARRRRFGDYAVVGRSVTIARPRSELFAFWRDFQNLPRFMESVEDVRQISGKTFAWTIKAPLGRTVTIKAEIVEEDSNRLIAWRSIPGSDIDTEGRVTFKKAPGERGTIVTATIAYIPPAGGLGRLAAKVLQREPSIQTRRELKRFKMLMETGEVATSTNQRSN